MKSSRRWIVLLLLLLIIAISLSGCGIFSNPSQPNHVEGADPEDMFELDEIQIEVEIPQEIDEADYFFTLDINREGTVFGEPVNYSQSDEVEVDVYAKDDKLYGKNEYGDQIVFVLQEGGCTMHCAGDIGYIVTGELDTHCIMTLHFTQIPHLTSCTSECAPGVPLTWTTGVGEVVIDPLEITFKDLSKGVSRIEELGNMKWESEYKLKEFHGTPSIKYCGKNDLP